MSSSILSLFGDETPPEQLKAVGKSRSVAPKAEKKAPASQEKEEEKKPVVEEAWEGDKQYYSIGEVAAILNVTTSNVRFWTKEFDMKVRTTRKGDRLYNPEQVKKMKTIYHLVKERGFTISGAKTSLKTNKKSVATIDLKQSLLQLRNRLLQIRNQLK